MKLFTSNRKRFRRHFGNVSIDIRILGEEYKEKDFTGKDICKKRGIQSHFNKRDLQVFQASDLRERVKSS